jgi:hypothetical protein
MFRGWEKIKIKFYFLTICSLSKMGKLKYLNRGQNKNIFWNKILFRNGPKYIDFFHVLHALEHHTYSEYDVEEARIKIKKYLIFFMKMAIFLGRRSEKR